MDINLVDQYEGDVEEIEDSVNITLKSAYVIIEGCGYKWDPCQYVENKIKLVDRTHIFDVDGKTYLYITRNVQNKQQVKEMLMRNTIHMDARWTINVFLQDLAEVQQDSFITEVI